jgi:hypothetical protein
METLAVPQAHQENVLLRAVWVEQSRLRLHWWPSVGMRPSAHER